MDIEACLKKIDSFLSRFKRRDVFFDIPFQKPGPSVSEKVAYEIGADEPKAQRTIWSRGKLLGRFDETAKIYAAAVLSDYLAGGSDSPLKKAIVKTGLGQEVLASVQDGLQQVRAAITVWNTDEDKLPEVQSAIRSALNEVIKKGADQARLAACLNSFAFRMRDKDSGIYPRSVSEAMNLFAVWLYGCDPAQGLLIEKPLKKASAMLDGAGFEGLIRELFLDDENTVTVTLVPSNTLGVEKLRKETERVRQLSSAWTQEYRDSIVKKTEALHVWQQTPDTGEALSSIPMLKLSDLTDKPEELSMHVTSRNEIPVLIHSTGSDLVTFKAWFNASDIALSELPYLCVLSKLYGTAATKRHSSGEVQRFVKQHFGRFSVSPAVYPAKEKNMCRVFLSASAVCLPEEAEKAGDLFREILAETIFCDRTLLKEQLDQNTLGMQMSLSSNGHSFAMKRVLSRFSAAGAANEALSGIELARFFKSLAAKSIDDLDAVLNKLDHLSGRLVSSERLTLSITENTPESVIRQLVSTFPPNGGSLTSFAEYAPHDEKNVSIPIPAQVGYAAMGTNLKLRGREFTGSYLVLAGILNYVYLWSEIRVRGGAYGCGFTPQDSGDISYFTYRDPKPGRSLGIMEGAADFVRGFIAEKPDLTAFILGSVNALDPLLNSADRMNVSEARYFKGISYDKVCRLYSELIHTTPEDILTLCDALEELREDSSACVVAGKTLIEDCGKRMGAVITL